MKYRVFVDGQEGTTGLKIRDYLSARSDIEALQIDPEKRKDEGARSILLNEADLVFLCLPDAAARRSVSLVTNPNTRIIDASTAHRTDPDWTYGLPELDRRQRLRISESKKVSVPGCHATGLILALRPLIQEGLVPRDYPVTCCSITGYSGGGRAMIAEYEAHDLGDDLRVPRHYALGLDHKHLPEMQQVLGLTHPPIFTPVVADYYKGMAVSAPLFSRLLNKPATPDEVRSVLSEYYAGEHFVRVMPCPDEKFFNLQECNDTNGLDIFVFGNTDRILLISRLDNLGKGASGAAVQNMNLMLGLPETMGLEVRG
ncbi:MAG: N-acetyl-gamma-glutamyl-phosphate reductase [Armatimonadetes bacterium]|nr:N-acetyl-gamma-glutamyl-phosphate reductase [Armatimonadota bacterium]